MGKIIILISASLLFILYYTNTNTNKGVSVIGHRGGMVTYPENSLISFERATKYTNMIEMDVKFTKDNIPIILHDDTLDRVSSCNGAINSKIFKEIVGCRLKNKLGGYSSYKLTTLLEVMNSKILNKAILIIEIEDKDEEAIDNFMYLINNKKNVQIQSFDINILRYIYNTYHHTSLYYISYKLPTIIEPFLEGLILNYKSITKTTKKETGKKIYIWTVNKKEDFEKYSKYDIDGIMTDDVRYFSSLNKKGIF